MKAQYDQKTVNWNFEVEDKVLVLLPMSIHALKAKFQGPYKIMRKANEVSYVIGTPDRQKKTPICYINMLKPYLCQDEGAATLAMCTLVGKGTKTDQDYLDVL